MDNERWGYFKLLGRLSVQKLFSLSLSMCCWTFQASWKIYSQFLLSFAFSFFMSRAWMSHRSSSYIIHMRVYSLTAFLYCVFATNPSNFYSKLHSLSPPLHLPPSVISKIQNSFLLSKRTWINEARGARGEAWIRGEVVWILLHSTSGLVNWIKFSKQQWREKRFSFELKLKYI